MRNAIVFSASSDIGAALCKNWKEAGWNVFGTYRTESKLVDELKVEHQIQMIHCDFSDIESIKNAYTKLKEKCFYWDVLVFASGIMEPIGNFEEVNFDEWEQSVSTNLLSPLRMLHYFLPQRNVEINSASPIKPTVLFFAGAGTNNAALNYSVYALSKVALIKTCELLDAEIPDSKFLIIGPGWVNTKIHTSTLQAGEKGAGSNYQRTLQQISEKNWVPMEKVIDCCNWVINTGSNGVGGRNFSVAFDSWGTKDIEDALENNSDMYKLRRSHNSWSSK